MNVNKKVKQYGILIVGLMIGGGFAFGGIASYSGMVNTGQSSGGDGQGEFDATLPDSNFQIGSYGLSSQEQVVLAVRNDIVFVNALYRTEEDLDQIRQLEGVETNFNGRVFIQAVNDSEESLFTEYGITEFPQAVVVGGAGQRGSISIADDVSRASIISSSCRSFRNWGELSAYCQGR